MSFRIFVRCGTQIQSLPFDSVVVLGGAKSSGIAIEGLRHTGDYVLLNQKDGAIQAHPFRGRKAQVRTLEVHEWTEIEDLHFFVTREENAQTGDGWARYFQDLKSAFARLKDAKSVEKTFLELLNCLLQSVGMQKGLIIARGTQNPWDILLKLNVQGNEDWLSETVVQQTMSARAPLFIGHVGTSSYASSKSLVGSGLVSVLSVPLIKGDEVLGVCLLGSEWPIPALQQRLQDGADLLIDLMSMLLDDHLRERTLKDQVEALAASRATKRPFLTAAPAMEDAIEMARRVAPANIAVLIQGETGVGKEGMARWIHDSSDRKRGPFIAVNCGAIPGELLESLLFGHKKGAFTGAVSDQPGKIRQANGGTLFLDEIGDLPLSCQVKLLRFLQERKVEPIGGRESFDIDVRVVAASNRQLGEMVERDEFRSDLYYRVAEITIAIPALRERREDILLLARHFLNQYDSARTFHHTTVQWLTAQTWSGNVRELQSAIRRACVLAAGPEIMPTDFQKGAPSLTATVREAGWTLGEDTLEEAKARFIRRMIQEALQRTDGHRQKAADLLGITSRTLFRYLEDMKDESGDMTEMSGPEA